MSTFKGVTTGRSKRLAVMPQQRDIVSAEQSQLAEELLTAAQKAWPNVSSAQARQLDGSPEQAGCWTTFPISFASRMGKTEFIETPLPRLLIGIGGS
jgi:hypothetical protein